MDLTEADRLLDPAPMPIETGYERLSSGVLHVACRTLMGNVTGAMLEWWFRFRPDTQQYIWWHPIDHVSSEWIAGDGNSHIGSIHVVEEYFTGLPSEKLSIQFRPPNEFFDQDRYDEAVTSHRVSAAICGRVGFGHEPPRDVSGAVLGGRLLHIGRDTGRGLALRSHFYMGQDLPSLGVPRAEIEHLFPDSFGQALLMHCYNEFTFLAGFLPSLHDAENRDQIEIALPW